MRFYRRFCNICKLHFAEIAIYVLQITIVYHRYHFVIEFFLPVDKHGCEYEVRESDVRFSLQKKEADWWPRLLYENIRVRMKISLSHCNYENKSYYHFSISLGSMAKN